jgi:hypothetical protein
VAQKFLVLGMYNIQNPLPVSGPEVSGVRNVQYSGSRPITESGSVATPRKELILVSSESS